MSSTEIQQRLIKIRDLAELGNFVEFFSSCFSEDGSVIAELGNMELEKVKVLREKLKQLEDQHDGDGMILCQCDINEGVQLSLGIQTKIVLEQNKLICILVKKIHDITLQQ